MKPDTDTFQLAAESVREGVKKEAEVSDASASVSPQPEVLTEMPTEKPTEMPTEKPTEMPTEKPTEMPTENAPKVPCSVQILQVLSRVPEMTTKEIHAAVTTKTKSYITKTIKSLRDAGKILKVQHGRYMLNVEMMTRAEVQNAWTVNMLLNLYDREMARLLATPNIDYEELASVMDALYRCSMVVERTLKRWYLVDRGYDTNTRQAQEDAKKKTAEREKSSLESALPEDQVVVVGDYHESVRGIWDTLPEPEKKKRTL